MQSLRIPIAQISAEGLHVEAHAPSEVLRPDGAAPMRAEDLWVSGVLREVDETYVFTGQVAGAVFGHCDRCLVDVAHDFDEHVVWVFAHGVERPPADESLEVDMDSAELDESADVTLFSGTEIDLGARAWEEMVLATPSKLLCGPDCRGLCPQCGVNWNTGQCGCATEDMDKPLGNKGFSALRDMFPKVPEKPSEE